MKDNNNTIRSVRSIVLDALVKCDKSKSYSNIELDSYLKRYSLTSSDRSLFTVLFYGVIERKVSLDHVISLFNKTGRPLSLTVQNALRIAFYQLMFTDKIPSYAVVNEACNSVRSGGKGAVSFVNAVLRAFLRAYNDTSFEKVAEKNEITAPTVKYSCSSDVYNILKKGYGEKKAIEILEAQNRRSYISVTVNTVKISADELCKRFLEAGYSCGIPLDGINSIVFNENAVPYELPGYDEGLFFVQDTSSLRAVSALAPAPGEFVIDTCACPGGKSFAAAVMMNNQGRILSLDIHASKLSLIEKGAVHIGTDIIESEVCDGRTPLEEYFGKADAVICDAPCSGFGVISKKPEIRYKTAEEIKTLPDIQYEILSKSCGYVKKGGRLLYSTCTLNPDENDKISERFLETHKDFVRAEGKEKGITVFPKSTSSCDGFYFDIFYKI
ncbi:MAG: 16S rRNA (cytosine(967)-C(5))-methyltransferase RsmB [Ruminococcaceae bacterium]|nr:16S rRNA (cytosine(967)-C(5))-methyltransferase RsmB [Oscillospiraceae bacterium]